VPFREVPDPTLRLAARQESICKGKAVKLGIEKAKARGMAVGLVVDKMDANQKSVDTRRTSATARCACPLVRGIVMVG